MEQIGMVALASPVQDLACLPLRAMAEALTAVRLLVLVGTVAATPGRPLKRERRVKPLMALQLTVVVTQTIRGTEDHRLREEIAELRLS